MPNHTTLEIRKRVYHDSYHIVSVKGELRHVTVDIAKNTNPSDQLRSILSALGGHYIDDIIIESGFEEEVSDEVLAVLVKDHSNDRS